MLQDVWASVGGCVRHNRLDLCGDPESLRFCNPSFTISKNMRVCSYFCTPGLSCTLVRAHVKVDDSSDFIIIWHPH